MNRWRLVALALIAVGAAVVLLNPSDDVRNGTRALAFVVLAGGGALLAARGWFRRAVAVAVVLAGLGLALGGTAAAVIAGLIVVAGGAVAVITSPGWPVMGSRYERAKPAEETDLWAALDRGDDPTAR